MHQSSVVALCSLLLLTSFLLSVLAAPEVVPVKEEPAAVLKAGKAALEDKLYDLAQAQFEQYLKLVTVADKESEEAAVLLMRALHEQGKNEECLAVFKSKKGWMEKSEHMGAFIFWHAYALYELGRTEEAVKELAGYSENYPASEDAGRVVRLAAWCHLKMGKTDEALQLFGEFDRLYPASPEASSNLLDWGKALVSARKMPQALEVLSRLAKLPADQVSVQQGVYWYGLALLEEKKWEDASKSLLALAANPKAADDLKAEALLAVSQALNAVSKKDDALDALRRGVELARSPELKVKGEFEFARYLIDLGRLEQGIPMLKQCIARSPTNSIAESAQLRIAGALLEVKKYQEATDEYQHFLETFTNVTGQAEALAGKGWSLTGLGRHAEAATVFLKAYGLYRDAQKKEQCLFKVGDGYFANAQYKLALDTYEQFMKEFPVSRLLPNALFQAGESLVKSGSNTDAELRFKELSEKYPASPFAEEALLRIGELRGSQGKWLESIYAFNRVMGVYSNSLLYAQALHGRGVANHQLARFEEALQDFNGVTNRFPASSVFEHSFYMSAMCSYWLGHDVRALAGCRDFIKRYPASQWAAEAMFWIANYEYNEGQFETAEKDFLLFVEKYPKSDLADDGLFWAGLAASKHKEYISSIELLSRLAKEYPDSPRMAEARFTQAEALTELARFSEAILIFDEVITKFPASPLVLAAWGRKGDCQFSLGADDKKRYEESIESFRVVAGHSTASLDHVLRAEYQIGRSMEKLGRAPEAFQQYYKKVILRYLEDREKGVQHNEACKVWFTRAVLNAADLMEAKKDWRGAVSILERLIKAGVPGGDEVRQRIGKLKAEHWWLFYGN